VPKKSDHSKKEKLLYRSLLKGYLLS